MYSLIIIDDEERIASGISLLFPWEEIGFCVSGVFTSAAEALEFIRAHPVDVVLTDIEMPDMDGIALSCQLRQDYPQIHLIFFSGYSKYEYFRAAIQNGAVDFLMKPVNYAQLLECFERVRTQLSPKDPAVSNSLPQTDQLAEEVIRKIRQYLETHYRDASLEEAAELVNLSVPYLSRLFKEKSGISFRDLLLKIRMEKALSLVTDPNYKMYDIAYFIGYDNPKNFSRAFKAYYGETPAECRKRIGGQP